MSSKRPIAIVQGLKKHIRKRARTMGLRRSRYFGLPKTHLADVAVATAINVVQLTSWLRGDARAHTRILPFKQVMQLAA